MRTVVRGALSALLVASAGCSLTIDPASVPKPSPQTPTIVLAAPTGDPFPIDLSGVAGVAPASKNVTVTNGSGGTLASPIVTLTGGASTWLTVTPTGTAGGPYTLQVTPTATSAGSYTTTVTVTCAGASNSPQTFNVNYNVSAAPPTLAASPNPLSFPNGSVVGGSNPAPLTLTLTNSNPGGGGTLATPTAAVTSGASWLTAGTPALQLDGSYQVTVSANITGLSTATTYNGNIRITSAGAVGSPLDVPVSITLGSATLTTISLGAPTAFQATVGDLVAPGAKTLSVTNVGNPLATFAQPTASSPTYNPAGINWLTVDPSTGSGNSYAFQLHAAVAGLTAGTYTATFNVYSAGASNTPQPVTVTFVVAPKPLMTLTPSAPLTFTRTSNAAPPAQTITLDNNKKAATPASATMSDPVLSVTPPTTTWLTVSWPPGAAGTGGPYTITVQPIDNQAPGTYTATLSVDCANASNSPQTVTITYNVPGIGIGAPYTSATSSATPMTFAGALPATNDTPKNLTITNSGAGTLAAPTATVTSGGSWLTAGAATPNGSGGYIVPITTNVTGVGGAAGTYNGTIDVTSPGAKNSPQTVYVQLTVSPAVQPILSVGSLAPFTLRQGSGGSQTQTLAISNTGTGTLAAPTFVVTPASAWLALSNLRPNGTGFLVDVTATVGSATAAGSPYNGSIQVTAGTATNSPATVPVTMQVTTAAAGGCVASASHKVCAGTMTEGAAASIASASHTIQRSRTEAGGATTVQSATHKIARGASVPAAATP